MQRETSESAPVRRIRTPQTSPPDDSVDPFSLSLYNLSKVLRYPLNWTEPLLIELDTAVSVSVVSEETYKKHFVGMPLMLSNTRLRVYTRHPLKVHGQLIPRPERRCPTSCCWKLRPIHFRKRLPVSNKSRLDEDLQHSRIRDRPPTGRGFPVAHNYPKSP